MSAPGGGRRPPPSRRGPGRPAKSGRPPVDDAPVPPGVATRQLAVDALVRIDEGGAYANLVLPRLLDKRSLAERDRAFVTELVYGATRMRRSCDWLVDRFTMGELEPRVRALLRVGAYQLAFLDTPPHAAVGATVEAAPKKVRGLVNAVLRRVAEADRDWPDDATRLSYPDWIVDRLTADLGATDAVAALEQMNEAAEVTEREDGYTQDRASQWVADAVGATAGERVLDVCAAPGGKATRLASTGATVVAADRRASRARLIDHNVDRLDLHALVHPIVVDGTAPAFPPASFDRILVDAPCSGLGALRRRPDARWRIDEAGVAELAALQRRLLDATVPLLRPGGTLVYSVCTLTDAEGQAMDDHLATAHPGLEPTAPLPAPWHQVGRGHRLLPQSAGTDGMYLLRLTAP